MIIQEVIDILEELSPLGFAEDFDNVGLLVGNANAEVSGILVTLDSLENVVEEAIEKQHNLIISFHPIIFKGLKKLTGASYVERVVIKAIQHNIAIYSIHTALDNSWVGVNAKICEVLGITKTKILIPQKGTLKKLTTYVPMSDAERLRSALFEAGGGQIGNYSSCSFSIDGTGSFKPEDKAKPVKGQIGAMHYENETQIHIIFSKINEARILKALFKNHPYEEVAYEIQTLENANQTVGLGMIGELENAVSESDFLAHLKKTMRVAVIRHSELIGKKIQRVAVLGGSGAFAIAAAKAQGAAIFITADVKYHQFYEAEGKMVIADIGHYETEQFTKNLIVDYLTKKIPNFAIALSERITNPIKYY